MNTNKVIEILDECELETNELITYEEEVQQLIKQNEEAKSIIKFAELHPGNETLKFALQENLSILKNNQYKISDLSKKITQYRFATGKAFNRIVIYINDETKKYIDNRVNISHSERKNIILDLDFAIDKLKELNSLISPTSKTDNVEETSTLKENTEDDICENELETQLTTENELTLKENSTTYIKPKILSIYSKNSKKNSYQDMIREEKDLIIKLANETDDIKTVIDILETDYACNFKVDYFGEDLEKKFKQICYNSLKNESPFNQRVRKNLEIYKNNEPFLLNSGLTRNEKIIEVLKEIGIKSIIKYCPNSLINSCIKVYQGERELAEHYKIYSTFEQDEKYFIAIHGSTEIVVDAITKIILKLNLQDQFNFTTQ